MLRRHFAALSLAALTPLPAAAQSGKVAKIVVGFPAGQGIDLVSRIVADALKDVCRRHNVALAGTYPLLS